MLDWSHFTDANLALCVDLGLISDTGMCDSVSLITASPSELPRL